jgi:hypothetical protein
MFPRRFLELDHPWRRWLGRLAALSLLLALVALAACDGVTIEPGTDYSCPPHCRGGRG